MRCQPFGSKAKPDAGLFIALLSSIISCTWSVREALDSYEGFLDVGDGFIEETDGVEVGIGHRVGSLLGRFEAKLSRTRLGGALSRVGLAMRSMGASLRSNMQSLSTRVASSWKGDYEGTPAGSFSNRSSSRLSEPSAFASFASLGLDGRAHTGLEVLQSPVDSATSVCQTNDRGQSLGCRLSEVCKCGMLEQCFSTTEELVSRSAENRADDPGVCSYSLTVLVTMSLALVLMVFLVFVGLRVYAQWRERIASLYAARRSAGLLLGDVDQGYGPNQGQMGALQAAALQNLQKTQYTQDGAQVSHSEDDKAPTDDSLPLGAESTTLQTKT